MPSSFLPFLLSCLSAFLSSISSFFYQKNLDFIQSNINSFTHLKIILYRSLIAQEELVLEQEVHIPESQVELMNSLKVELEGSQSQNQVRNSPEELDINPYQRLNERSGGFEVSIRPRNVCNFIFETFEKKIDPCSFRSTQF